MPRLESRVGLQIREFWYPGVPDDRMFEAVADTAVEAERAGFDAIWVMDHFMAFQGAHDDERRMPEGTVLLGALAARTRSAALGLLVAGVPHRNPALHAKATTTLDWISGGRAVHGLGSSWYVEEQAAYGYSVTSPRERAELLEDALRIARAMFTQRESTVEGRHHRVVGALNEPAPIRGDIPILVGGVGERRTLRLVARYADASNVSGDPARVRHLNAVIDRHCEAEGRDPREITRTVMHTVLVARTHEEAQRKRRDYRERKAALPDEVFDSVVIAGDPSGIAEQVDALREAGADTFIAHLPQPGDLEAVRMVGSALSGA